MDKRLLKKVRQFTRKVVPKGEFEFAFLKQFDQMYQWAEAAVEELERSDYEKLYAEEMKKSGMIHGEYNYTNWPFSRIFPDRSDGSSDIPFRPP